MIDVIPVQDYDLGRVKAIVNFVGAIFQPTYIGLVLGAEPKLPVRAVFFSETWEVVESG